MDVIRFAILGLGLGAVYALVAQGIVLIYRGSGVVNFAHGMSAGAAGYVYFELHQNSGWPVVVSIAAAVLFAAAIGAVMQLLVMRPLRHSSPLTRVIATIAVLSILLEIGQLRYGSAPLFVQPFLGSGVIDLGGTAAVGVSRIWLFGTACVLTLVLWLVYRFTAFGLATTAVAENERTARALGVSPDRVELANWVAGSAIAGLAGVMLAPIVSLTVADTGLLVLPALAAALLGGFRSFPLTLVGGLGIGIAEAEMARYVSTPGWSKATPFLVIVAVLVVRGRALPLRGHVLERLPAIGLPRLGAASRAALLAVGFGLLFVLSDTGVSALTTSLIFGTICMSVVVVTGYAGQLSLAQFALAGMGAFIASRLADGAGFPFVPALLAGVLGTVPVGLLVAIPALRTRGINLAIATMGLALAIYQLVLSNSAYTGGLAGTTVDSPTVLGWSVDPIEHPHRYAGVALVAFTFAAIVVANLRRGRTGRRLIAVRANERAAAALGIDVVGAKLYAFAVSSGIAALGGVLLAFRQPNVLFNQFDVFGSIQIVVLTVLGGAGFVLGGVLGGLFATGGLLAAIGDEFIDFNRIAALVAGVGLLVTIIAQPDGVAAILVRARRRLPRLRDRDRPEALPPSGEVIVATPATLEVRDVAVAFGGVHALNGVSMSVASGQIVGLIGSNGAGKTTLIDVICGFAPGYRGSVLLNGTSIDRASPARRARAGVARSFQSLELFDALTVRENLLAACEGREARAYLTDLVWPRRVPLSPATVAAVREFGLVDSLDARPAELSAGQRRLVGIARAIAAEPSILLLDEPAAGLDHEETRELGRVIELLAREWGMGVVLVEHDLGLVLDICDQLVVLDAGHVLCAGTRDDVRRDPRVIEVFIGDGAAA